MTALATLETGQFASHIFASCIFFAGALVRDARRIPILIPSLFISMLYVHAAVCAPASFTLSVWEHEDRGEPSLSLFLEARREDHGGEGQTAQGGGGGRGEVARHGIQEARVQGGEGRD